MPKFIVTGTNRWGNLEVYIHKTFDDLKVPTPFMTKDINGNTLYSKMSGDQYVLPKEVELKKGDYIMLITEDDLRYDKERVCGHMHYFDGEKLISVYTGNPWTPPKLDTKWVI